MVTMKQQLVSAARKLTNNGTNAKTGVTVHDTGNPGRGADAQAHANLQAGGNSRAASWHWQVDDKVAIQSYRHNDKCWHGGHGTANNGRISVEICINSDGDYKKAVRNAAELVAWILKDIGRTPNDIDQHASYPQGSTGWQKDCPAQLRRGRDSISWSDFLGMVRKAFDGKPATVPASSGSGSNPKPKAKQPYSHDQAAQEVVDGKWGDGNERKRRLEEAGFVFNSVQRRVNALLGAKTTTTPANSSTPVRKTEAQVAADIANGRGGWGNDPERSRKLTAAGYNAGNIQKRVNSLLLGGNNAVSKPSVNTIANQIINGQGNWGNEPGRSQKLRAAGYDAAAVQRRVNQLLS